MKSMTTQSHNAAAVCREELERAIRRIEGRLENANQRTAVKAHDGLESIRKFYEDLTDNSWTDADESCLREFGDVPSEEIKQMMRDSYRHSAIIPIPSFTFLMNVARKLDPGQYDYHASQNSAISALERERLANLLHEQLTEAAEEIISMLDVGEAKCGVVRARLDTAQGHIISHLMPLV